MDKIDRLVTHVIASINKADLQTEQCAGVFFRCLRNGLEEFLRQENQPETEMEEIFAEASDAR